MVTLDGHDLRSLEPRWLRQQLGVVRQEPALFAASVRDNVCYGMEQGSVSTAQVEAALRDANAFDFVSQVCVCVPCSSSVCACASASLTVCLYFSFPKA